MRRSKAVELPPEQQRTSRRARRLEWFTIVYLISAIMLLALVLGSSQAMKTAWFDDMLSLIPPIAFLVAVRYSSRAPNNRFPYGFHRMVSIGHLCAAFALFSMGTYLLVDAAIKLLTAEHPTIGNVILFGQPVWLGWLMLAALVYTGLPPAFLGRAKMPLAEELHNKVLYTDAEMNKADWLTAGAAMAGVVGIGFGLWWADAAAAGLISLNILKDGFTNLRRAVNDLMDQTPTTVSHDNTDPLRDELAAMFEKLDWVKDAEVRLREEGQVYFGEVFVVPEDRENLTEKIDDALRQAYDLDWRVYDLTLMPVDSLPAEGEGMAERDRSR